MHDKIARLTTSWSCTIHLYGYPVDKGMLMACTTGLGRTDSRLSGVQSASHLTEFINPILIMLGQQYS